LIPVNVADYMISNSFNIMYFTLSMGLLRDGDVDPELAFFVHNKIQFNRNRFSSFSKKQSAFLVFSRKRETWLWLTILQQTGADGWEDLFLMGLTVITGKSSIYY